MPARFLIFLLIIAIEEGWESRHRQADDDDEELTQWARLSEELKDGIWSEHRLRRQLEVSSRPRSSHHSAGSFITLIADRASTSSSSSAKKDRSNLNSIRSDQDGTFSPCFFFFLRRRSSSSSVSSGQTNLSLPHFALASNDFFVFCFVNRKEKLFLRYNFWTGQFCVVSQ